MTKTLAKRVLAAIIIMMALESTFTVAATRRTRRSGAGTALIYLRQGSFNLRRGRRTKRVRESILLNVGDKVTMNRESRGIIYQAYAPLAPLPANESKTVQRLSPPPQELSAERYNEVVRIHLRSKQRSSQSSPTVLGGPTSSYLTILELRNSVVLERRPKFEWTQIHGAAQYVVTVFDKDDRTVWTAQTSETFITYPEHLPQLSPGKYKLEVTTKINNQWSRDPAFYDASVFSLVSAADAADRKRACASP